MLSESNFGHPKAAIQASNQQNSFVDFLSKFSSKGVKVLQESGKKVAAQAKEHPVAATTIAMLAGIALHRLVSKRK